MTDLLRSGVRRLTEAAVSAEFAECLSAFMVEKLALEHPAASPPSVHPARVVTPVLFSPSPHAERRFREFFTAHIRNPDPRPAYLSAARRFATWCERRDLVLDQVEPMGRRLRRTAFRRVVSPERRATPGGAAHAV